MRFALLRGHVEQVGDLAGPQHGGVVHVERQGGGTAVATDLRRHANVVRVGGTESAVLLGHAEREESAVTQVRVVLEREDGIAIYVEGTCGEGRAELADDLDQCVPVDGCTGNTGLDSSALMGCNGWRHRTIVEPPMENVNTVDESRGCV